MNRLMAYTIAILLGAVVAGLYLVTGWTAHAGILVFLAVAGFWIGALALMALAFTAVLGERKRILASSLIRAP